MLKKNKVSAAVKLALASTMVVALSGCLVEGSTSVSTSGGSVTQVTNPTGTVTGTVQDTNGNPISGVTVYLAGQTATTDAGGVYTFSNVAATNTVGADSSITSSSLSVTVDAPAGYLDATVTVAPQAQVDGTNAGDTTDSGATVFVQGYVASAGVAVLPELGTTVSGVLRDSTTGEAIANMDVRLDLESVNGVAQQQVQNGVTTTYQTGAYTATTEDATGTNEIGYFSFANVPNDADLRFMVEGYGIVDVDTDNNPGTTTPNVNTNDETLVYVGNVLVADILADDDTPPWVASVTGIVDQTAATGMFNDDIDGAAGTDIVINFSETIDGTEIDTNSVIVWDDVNGYQTTATATLAADGQSMTVTTAAAIDAGAIVHIFMLRADFVDSADNQLGAGTAIGYDSNIPSASGAEYVRLEMEIFTETNTNAAAVTLAQESEDTTGTNDFDAVQTSNVAFLDVDDEGGAGNFQQLNSADDDAGPAGADSAERLSALATALGAANVEVDVARVSFTPTNATTYTVEIQDADGNTLDPSAPDYNVTFTSNVPGDVPTSTTTEDITFSVDDTNDVVMLIDTMEPGFTVIVTPADDLGHLGTADSVVLADTVEPTTVLQDSYGATPVDDAVVTSVDFGNGGELISVGAQTIGTPYLNVTPQLLDNLTATGAAIETVGTADNTLLHELMELNKVDTGTGAQYITPAAAGPYDATAYAALNTARSIGVAMSEDIALTATAPAYSGTNATLSGWAAHNDVVVDDAGTPVNVDLVDVDVDDVLALAADDNADIDFTNAMQDEAATPNVAGTAANANPRVVIRDAMPPMVESAVYNGTDIVVTFNEAVAIDFTTDTIVLGGVTIGLTNASLDATNTILTILPEDGTVGPVTGSWVDGLIPADIDGFGDLNRTGVFTLAQYTETSVVTYTVQNANQGEGHAALSIDNINDAANGNDWTNDNRSVTIPSFAAIDATGLFEVETAPTPPTAGATVATLNYVFEHPLDVATTFAGCGGSVNETATVFTLDSLAVQGCFTVNAGAITSTGATYTKSSRTLSVNVTPAVAFASTDTIEWNALGGTAVGEYDSTEAYVVPNVVVP